MGKLIVNGALAMGAYNLTTQTMAVASEFGVEEQDGTVFGDEARNFLAGTLETGQLGVQGFTDFADPHSVLNAALGGSGTLITLASGRTDGDWALIVNAMAAKYSPLSGAIGDRRVFDLMAKAADGGRIVMGRLAAYGVKSATGSSAGYQLGAVGASQSVYASLHAYSYAGTTPELVVTLESDDNSGFTSATTRATFTTVGEAISSELKTVAGAITDDYWRLTWTLTGSGAQYGIVGAIAIR